MIKARLFPITKTSAELATRIHEMPAATLEGHRARARALLAWAPDLADRNSGCDGPTGDYLIASLLRDLAGGAWGSLA